MAAPITQHRSIDLSDAAGVIFLFGMAGAGKSYIGDLLASAAGRTVYHADDDLTEPMKQALLRKEGFTEEMRDEFFGIIVDRILQLRAAGHLLIVTQAAYKQRHREFIREWIKDVEFIHVCASDEVIVSRLQRRGDWITPDYAKKMCFNFEQPPRDCKAITNNTSREDLWIQLVEMFPSERLHRSPS